MAYVSRYSPRPFTAAYNLSDNIGRDDKKKRDEELMAIISKTNLENSQVYLNKITEILIDGKNKKGEWTGRTRTNKKVKLINTKEGADLTGLFIKTKITHVQSFGMEGEIIK